MSHFIIDGVNYTPMDALRYKRAYEFLRDKFIEDMKTEYFPTVDGKGGCDYCPVAYSCMIDNHQEVSCKDWFDKALT